MDPPVFDLSGCPKLKDVEFHTEYLSTRWIIVTLQSAKPESLRQVAVHAYGVPSDEMEEMAHEWRDLDRLLSRLWNLYSILPKVTCACRLDGEVARRLMPDLADRGVVYDHRW